MRFCLLLLVSLRLAFSSCVTALFLLGLPRSHRLNAFVIQTKLNLYNQGMILMRVKRPKCLDFNRLLGEKSTIMP